MAIYRVLKGETIYDVASKLYNGDIALGIQDLLTHNPTIDLNTEDLFGIELIYTPNLKRVKPVFPAANIPAPITIYKTWDRQSIYDLTIQLYGDFEKIGNLLPLFPDLNNNIELQSEISVEDQADPIAIYFLENRIIVATDISEGEIPMVGDFRLLEDGGFRLLEDDGFRLLE